MTSTTSCLTRFSHVVSSVTLLSVGILTGPLLTAMPADATIFYVAATGNDSANGSSESPWRTWQKAANTMVAGDTTIVRDGAYEEDQVVFSTSGTLNNPITLEAEHQWLAKLESTSGSEPAIYIQASYITIKDVRIGVSVKNVRPAGYVSKNGSGFCWPQRQPTPASPSSGYVGCRFTGVLIEATPDRDTGIKSAQDFSIIENSFIHNEVELFKNQESIVRNNTIDTGGPNGTYLVNKGGVRNAKIYNNVVHMNKGGAVGIYAGGCTGDAFFFDTAAKIESYNLAIFNNVILAESSGNTALTFRSDSNSTFFNNVIIGDMNPLNMTRSCATSAPANMNPTVLNTIFKGTGTTAITGGLTVFSGTKTINYNNFFGYRSGVPLQANAVTGDPLFVDQTSDWHLQAGSPAIRAGTTVTPSLYGGGIHTNIKVTYDGRDRTIPWDLGIYATNSVAGDTTPPLRPIIISIK